MTKCYFWWALIAKPKDPMKPLKHTFHLSTNDVYYTQQRKNLYFYTEIFQSSFTEVN